MTLLGIAQIVIFFADPARHHEAGGHFMYRVFEGERTFLHPIFRPLERLIYRLGGVRENEEQSWVALFGVHDLAEHLQFSFRVSAAAVAGTSAAEPHALLDAAGALKRHADDAGPGLQHGRQLHDEYQLAVLFARHDDELLRHRWPRSRCRISSPRRWELPWPLP